MAAPYPGSIDSPSSLVEWVNTFQGTDSHFKFSTGNTLPLTTMPHGMIGWIPQTDPGNWPFDLRMPSLQGFRGTHQPSPWTGDHGNFLVLVGSGPRPPLTPAEGESYYERTTTIAAPHYFRTRLARPDVLVEITPTQHGGCFRFTFPRNAEAWITIRPAAGRILALDLAQRSLVGVSTAARAGVPPDFGCWFAARCDEPLDAGECFEAPVSPPAESGTSIGAWVRVRPDRNGTVTLRIATSFISADQAAHALCTELDQKPFDALRREAETVWNARLGAVTIDGTDAQRRTFYGCLFRSLLYPRAWHETDSAGRQMHRSPYDGGIHPGPLYTDIGFWDAHRSLMPLLTLIAPDLLGDMVQGWVNTFREGGWLPSWASPGYIPCMVGSHAGVVIADAFAKGIRNFDVEAAYAAVRHDATVDPHSFSHGRAGLNRYAELGWVPADEFDHSAARTCDYAFADFAAAAFGAAMGDTATATRLAARSLNYRNVFDPVTGFLRGRKADGSWPEPFREFAWSADYIEGSAWQHTWSAPHDAAGLIAAMGGEEAFVARLDRMLGLPPHYEVGRYEQTIHEMLEMAAVPFGQYAHSNEPVHHVLHLYTAAGRPDRAQHWIRRVLTELYSPLAFPGDEDNGAMGSWYVLNALGLYSLSPGHPAWILGAPLFERAVVQPPNRAPLHIRAVRESADHVLVSRVELDGRPIPSLDVSHEALGGGGELEFHFTADAATARARGRLRRPFSVSDGGIVAAASSGRTSSA